MIRVLLGLAMPVFAVGAAAALIGPELVSTPRGEPILVAGGGPGQLQNASFDAADCSDLRFVALTFHSRPDGLAVTIEEGRDADAFAREAYVVAFDGEGGVLASGRPDAVSWTVAAGCGPEAEGSATPGSI